MLMKDQTRFIKLCHRLTLLYRFTSSARFHWRDSHNSTSTDLWMWLTIINVLVLPVDNMGLSEDDMVWYGMV